MGSAETADTIRDRLIAAFAPLEIEVRDDSARHAGHAGATSGGGHFQVLIVSAAFEGRTLLERHRAVNDTLRELFGERIHALGLRTLAPAEWEAEPGRPPRPSRR